jgi:hypothetical protein
MKHFSFSYLNKGKKICEKLMLKEVFFGRSCSGWHYLGAFWARAQPDYQGQNVS